jgi:hypothetical protein
MGRNRTKARKLKKKSTPSANQKGWPAAGSARKNSAEATRHFDKVVREFDGAAEGLQISLEKLRGTLTELIDIGVRRDRLLRVKALASDGILDGLQRLATALESLGPNALPESLHRSARMAVDHICRTFEVQPMYQIGESLTVMNDQNTDFDWSADRCGKFTFPADVEILRSGWKAGDAVLVLPRAVRRHCGTSA